MSEASAAPDTGRRRIVVVTGLSGAGKASVLHALEDAGYDAVDNPPIGLLEGLAERADRDIAIGVDARTRGFDAELLVNTLASLRRNPALLPELVYVWADDVTLMRRYTETRRRHPLAPRDGVAAGIEIEQEITFRLRETADLLIDTSGLPVAGLRRLIEERFGPPGDRPGTGMVVSLISFSYAKGLPKEADLVFDARFLRNPHYDPILRPRSGLDPEVGAYIRHDPDFAEYLRRVTDLLDLAVPRFVQEGKKYATIAVGCTGGRHRSVYMVERLASHLTQRLAVPRDADKQEMDWRLTISHRELRENTNAPDVSDRSDGAGPGAASPARNEVDSVPGGEHAPAVQAQEA